MKDSPAFSRECEYDAVARIQVASFDLKRNKN
jgi:hypothetical protein